MKPLYTSMNFYTKIQEVHPSYLSTLVTKEFALDVNVEHQQKTYKIKNCIDSVTSNSDLYKRFSKPFLSNVSTGIDQMIVFCGSEVLARLETSIGMKNNPGVFMVCGIGILDDKYQNQFVNYDVQVSFIEYIDGNFYDLLIPTSKSLKITRKEEYQTFGESSVKISTFSHFLKLFKIALFHNKERESFQFLNNSSQYQASIKTKSTFIMILQTKKYDGTKVQVQRNAFVDFGFLQCGNSKTAWQYFIIQLNNLTNRKKMHYHLIEPNPLLSLMKKYLLKGRTTIIYSFSTNPEHFKQNYSSLDELRELVQLSNNSQIPRKKQENELQKKYEKIKQKLTELCSGICERNYQSLRSFRQMREECKRISEEIKQWILKIMKVLIQIIENKRGIKLLQHEMIYDQILLIGSCVKSDHYKDFYTSRTYLSLEREVQIKTEQLRTQLQALYKIRQELQEKFMEIRFKQKPSSVEFEEFLVQLRGIGGSIEEFFQSILFNIIYDSERTITNEILKQVQIKNHGQLIIKTLKDFIISLFEFRKQNKIVSTEGMLKDTHLCLLVRQINELGQKYRKKKKKGIQTQKCVPLKPQTKFTKLPIIQHKSIHITGNIKLEQLLTQP